MQEKKLIIMGSLYPTQVKGIFSLFTGRYTIRRTFSFIQNVKDILCTIHAFFFRFTRFFFSKAKFCTSFCQVWICCPGMYTLTPFGFVFSNFILPRSFLNTYAKCNYSLIALRNGLKN